MNVLDIILAACFAVAIAIGIKKGFIAQVVSILGLILGVWLSFSFSSAVSEWLGKWIEASHSILNIISFITIFILVTVCLYLIGKALETSIKIVMLGWLNRLLGALFSFLNCIIILGLAIMFFNSINEIFGIVNENNLSESVIYTFLKDTIYRIFPYLREYLSK